MKGRKSWPLREEVDIGTFFLFICPILEQKKLQAGAGLIRSQDETDAKFHVTRKLAHAN